jgi:hypothetical protein
MRFLLFRSLVMAVIMITASGTLWSTTVGREHHARSIIATLTLRTGDRRIVTLRGVGCSEQLCSTTHLETRSARRVEIERTRLRDIASMRITTPDEVTLVMKDGSTSRMSIVPLNRTLYVADAVGHEERIDVGQIASLEFESSVQNVIAHHSSVAFDLSRTFSFTGTMTKVDWRNPHIVISMAVKRETGVTEDWDLETGAPSWFRNRKLDRSDVERAVGQEVSVQGVPSKDGSRYGYLYRITFADGRTWDLR